MKEFEADFGQFKAFKMGKEALYNYDVHRSSDFFIELMSHIVD
jgi:hypothetical protein